MKTPALSSSLVLALGLLAACGGSGDPGNPGPEGTEGPEGPPGEDGATGPTGEMGDPGAMGATGARGELGDTGDTGARGPRGATGASGMDGATGATGESGPVYVSTILVSPPGTPTQNGNALLAAINGISGNGPLRPMLVKLEPGVYDVGPRALIMKNYVDLEGSGEGVTTISGTLHTLYAADHVEIRSVTITSAGSQTVQVAVGTYVGTVGFRMTNVTATVTGSGGFQNALDGHGDFKNVTLTATATGGGQAAAFFHDANTVVSTFVASSLTGTSFSALAQSGSARFVSTLLHGPVLGATSCIACYDESFTELDANCE